LEHIHLLLVEVPRMLRDIVVGLVTDADDVDIAGEVRGAGAADALSRTGADFVISGRDDEELVHELLGRKPAVEVLTVTGDGRHGSLHRLVPLRTPLGELWPDRLLEIVRGARTEIGPFDGLGGPARDRRASPNEP
jgi:hypothetical protein